MTIDIRHEIGKQERIALAVLAFGSLFSLGVGYTMLLYQNKAVGFVIISVSGLLLLVVLIINSLHYTNPRTYNRLVLLLNPNAVLSDEQQQQQPPTRPVHDSPPSYKKSWAKAFKQRTTAASTSPSSSTEPEGTLPPPEDVDLERHLVGRVAVEERGNGRSGWRKLRGAMKHGKRSQEVCVQEVQKSAQEQQEEEGNSPPPFEVAILELSVTELQRINENLPQSKLMSTSDAVEMEEGFLTVLDKPSKVFSVEQEFRRRNTETTEYGSNTVEVTLSALKTELEVAPVHSLPPSSDTTSVSQDVTSPQDVQSNLRVASEVNPVHTLAPSSDTTSASQDVTSQQDVQSNQSIIVINDRLTSNTDERSGCRVQEDLRQIQ